MHQIIAKDLLHTERTSVCRIQKTHVGIKIGTRQLQVFLSIFHRVSSFCAYFLSGQQHQGIVLQHNTLDRSWPKQAMKWSSFSPHTLRGRSASSPASFHRDALPLSARRVVAAVEMAPMGRWAAVGASRFYPARSFNLRRRPPATTAIACLALLEPFLYNVLLFVWCLSLG